MGAWIEIVRVRQLRVSLLSHPTWVRGLKYNKIIFSFSLIIVAPHVGAWIEMVNGSSITHGMKVAPHVGAWIEMSDTAYFDSLPYVARSSDLWIEICLGTP